ncbi:MAG: TonB-dependent receptor family protein [Burkholderiaceae bacterium]
MSGRQAWAQTAVMLDPVRVQSTRTDTGILETPASVSLINGSDMRRSNLQINLSESLGAVPGLLIQNRQNYAQDLQVSIRGYGARSTFGVRGVRIYVDGIPATMPDGQGQTSNIDIASIDRVEVLQGPFSALYGNASGGVIDITTEKGSNPPVTDGGFTAGSYGTRRYGLKALGEADAGDTLIDYSVSLNHFRTDGYRDHSAADKSLGNVKLGMLFNNDGELTLTANRVKLRAQDPLGLTRESFENNPRGVTAGALDYNTRKTVDQTQGGLHYRLPLGSANELQAMVYYGERRTVQYQSIPVAVQTSPANPQHPGGVIDLTRQYMGADLRWTWQASPDASLIAGLAYDTLRERRQGYFNFTGSEPNRQLGVQGELRRNEVNTSETLDPYLQASWRFAERWILDTGVRYSTVRMVTDDRYITAVNADDSGSTRYRQALPFMALGYQFTPTLLGYVSAGRGFETPTINELSYRPDGSPGLNLALQPSTNTTVEAGVKARVGRHELTAAIYQTRSKNEIVSAGSSNGRSTFQNAGRTERMGLELGSTLYFGDHGRVDMAYSWIDARYRDDCRTATCGPGANPNSRIQAGNRIPGIPGHMAFAGVSWTPDTGWQWGLEGRYLSKIYVNDGNTQNAPAYFTASASVGYRWEAGPWMITSFARIDNLFNRRYAGSVIVNESNARYYEPAPGRHWGAGLSAGYTF